MSTYVKVCGLKQPENIRRVAAVGVDAIGLNFYSKSKRFVDVTTGMSLREEIPPNVDVVGVFVNAAADDVIHTTRQAGLNAIQFHGDESAAEIKKVQQACPDVKIFRAVRLSSRNLDSVVAKIDELSEHQIQLSAVLADAWVEGEFGGTGHRLDHELIQRIPPDWPPLIIAGGLNPNNVAECIQSLSPFGVDVASGVESAPGIKSLEAVQQFVANVRAAESR